MRVTVLTTIGFALLLSIASIYFWMNRIEIKAQEDYFLLVNKFTGNYCVIFPEIGYHYADFAQGNFVLCGTKYNKIEFP